jgi:hypothetical protein
MSSYAQQFVDSAIQHASRSIFDGICKQLPGRKTERGEFYMERTRNLIENDFELMQPANKERVQDMFESSVSRIPIPLVLTP